MIIPTYKILISANFLHDPNECYRMKSYPYNIQMVTVWPLVIEVCLLNI